MVFLIHTKFCVFTSHQVFVSSSNSIRTHTVHRLCILSACPPVGGCVTCNRPAFSTSSCSLFKSQLALTSHNGKVMWSAFLLWPSSFYSHSVAQKFLCFSNNISAGSQRQIELSIVKDNVPGRIGGVGVYLHSFLTSAMRGSEWSSCSGSFTPEDSPAPYLFNLLKTKRNLHDIRNHTVPRCKHFPPRL